MAGCALILYRKLPGLNKYLAYLPRGPVIDWEAKNINEWFEPMFEFLRRRNVFSIKMEPPGCTGEMEDSTIKNYLKEVRDHDLKGKTFRDLGPDEVDAHAEYVQKNEQRWAGRKKEAEGGFAI